MSEVVVVADDLRKKVVEKLRKGEKLVIHTCSLCQYPCGFLSLKNSLFYDNGCDCVSGPYIRMMKRWDDLDFYLMLENGHVDRIEKWANA